MLTIKHVLHHGRDLKKVVIANQTKELRAIVLQVYVLSLKANLSNQFNILEYVLLYTYS